MLTRLEEPKKHQLSLLQKMKLYDGKTLPGFTQDNVKELRKEPTREGIDGISAALHPGQDQQRARPRHGGRGLHQSLHGAQRARKGLCASLALDPATSRTQALPRAHRRREEEYEEIVKNEVQRAISADEGAIARLCANYIDNVRAYTLKEKVKNKYTGRDEEPG